MNPISNGSWPHRRTKVGYMSTAENYILKYDRVTRCTDPAGRSLSLASALSSFDRRMLDDWDGRHFDLG
jgi:hypothetical protein